MQVYYPGTAESPGDHALTPGFPTAAGTPEAPAPRGGLPPLSVPARGSSVVTGLDRACRAELVGFASPIGRLSAVLRITDETTGNTATSVVPVRIDGATETAELTVPPSDVRARKLRVETAAVRLRLPRGPLLDELAMPDIGRTSAHRHALGLTRALHGGELACA
jgi:hypothetical protein